MREVEAGASGEDETEAALLEVDLFLKYRVPHRAFERLQQAVAGNPQSILLRERLREIAVANNQKDEAARQCLALASLYIARDNFDRAQERLLDAKQADERISIASGLEAIRRARRQNRQAQQQESLMPPLPEPLAPTEERPNPVLAGDLSAVSIFDAMQIIENSRLTGALTVRVAEQDAVGSELRRLHRVLFNEGTIVGAEFNSITSLEAFRRIVELANGTFAFERSTLPFPVTIKAASNTNLILDSLRLIDESST